MEVVARLDGGYVLPVAAARAVAVAWAAASSGINGDRPMGADLGVVDIGVPPVALGVAGRDGICSSTPAVGVPEARRASGGVMGFPGLVSSFFTGVAVVVLSWSALVRFLRAASSSWSTMSSSESASFRLFDAPWSTNPA